jgi:hypothetical protein
MCQEDPNEAALISASDFVTDDDNDDSNVNEPILPDFDEAPDPQQPDITFHPATDQSATMATRPARAMTLSQLPGEDRVAAIIRGASSFRNMLFLIFELCSVLLALVLTLWLLTTDTNTGIFVQVGLMKYHEISSLSPSISLSAPPFYNTPSSSVFTPLSTFSSPSWTPC